MKSRKDWQRDWYRPVERSDMESDKEKRKNVVCATTADASQVMIVLSSNRRYRHTHTHTFWKALIWKCFISEDKHPQCMFIVVMHHLSVLSLSSVFPRPTSFFIPLCVQWGVTNWWFSGLKEAQMEKQMERVIGHVYAFYLRFPPPVFFLSLILSLSPLFPPSLVFNEQRWSPCSSSNMNFYFLKCSVIHVSSDPFAHLFNAFSTCFSHWWVMFFFAGQK